VRVLFVIAHLDKGGGQAVQVRQLMERLLPRVDGEFLALTTRPEVPNGSHDGPATIVGPLRFPEGLRVLRREIRRRKGQFDLIQAFDPYYALPAARLARASPLVIRMGAHPVEDFASRYHTVGRVAMRSVNLWLYSGTTVVVNARHLVSEFGGRPVVFIPNGVDVDRFPEHRDPEGARRELGLPVEGPIAVYTGKVIPRKNLEDLFLLARRLTSLHLVLVGSYREPYYGEGYYRQLLSSFPEVVPRVHAVGEVAMTAVPRYLEAADLFVFPSRLEGMPNSVLEAQAAGVAVIASRTEAHAEIISPDTGRMYGDLDELVRVASELLADPGARQRLGERARNVARERFSLEAAATAYLHLYTSLISEPAPGPRPRGS
jgi:glycosyltransferase involved in cell wall biosynthesis